VYDDQMAQRLLRLEEALKWLSAEVGSLKFQAAQAMQAAYQLGSGGAGGGTTGGPAGVVWGTTASAIAGGATGTVNLPGGGSLTGVKNPYATNAGAGKVCSVEYDSIAGINKLRTFDC
jgi:hypothetical protein